MCIRDSFVASQIYHLVENTCIAVAEFFGDAQTLEELRKASESKDQGLQIKGTVKGKEFSGANLLPALLMNWVRKWAFLP